jgi:ABC-type sugar transport system permease subunit
MNEENTKQRVTTWELIKSIPHYYFLMFEYILEYLPKGIIMAVQFIAKFILIGIMFIVRLIVMITLKLYQFVLAPIGRFFDRLNQQKVIHLIFLPFIYGAKSIVFILLFIPRKVMKVSKGLTMAQKKAVSGYGFLSPWIVGFIGLVFYPIVLLTFKSFNDVRQVGETYNYKWVGFDNYHRILRVDIDFMMYVQDFVVRVLLYTPVIIALAIIIAMLLNQSIKGKGFFRMVFFLPIIILNGELLSTMSDNGGMDIHLSSFVIDMLTTVVPVFALGLFVDLFSIIIEILWYTGVPILIFLAMLQKIDKSLYEAASIDGANAWSIFWKITLPIIRPAISVAVIFIVVFLANFDGNPINSEIVRSNGDPSRYQGYAAAMALIYSIIQIVVISLLLLLTRQRNRKGRA